MTNTIQQEFYEKYNIKPFYQYRVYIEYKNGQAIKYYWDKSLLIKIISDKSYKNIEQIKILKVCEVKKILSTNNKLYSVRFD